MEPSIPILAIDDGSSAAQLESAVERTQLFHGAGDFWGAKIDLRHPDIAAHTWFADGLSVAREPGVVMVTWPSSPIMDPLTLRPDDCLCVAGVSILPTAEMIDTPADQDRLQLRLLVARADGSREDMGAPLFARHVLGRRWNWAEHNVGELLWLRARLDDLDVRPKPRRGVILAEFALALDEAQRAVADAEQALAEAEKAGEPLKRWLLSGGELSPEDVAGLLHWPRTAGSAAARAGYAVARAEMALEIRPTATEGLTRQRRAKENSDNANKGKRRTDLTETASAIWEKHPTWSIGRVAKMAMKQGDALSNVCKIIERVAPGTCDTLVQRQSNGAAAGPL